MKYKKKPVVVEACRYAGGEVESGIPDDWIWSGNIDYGLDGSYLIIPTLERNYRCDRGDWIIRGAVGEFYPVKDSVFRATYEEVV